MDKGYDWMDGRMDGWIGYGWVDGYIYIYRREDRWMCC